MQLEAQTRTIHMYIGNEEVVCNNEINIVEQLKNCNTAVLNNCYPLSWETDKDYVSRFYMPKDYSLFKLIFDYSNGELCTEAGENILTEDGENITIGGLDPEVIFVGVIKKSKPINLRPDMPHFSTLQVLDFKTFLSEGDLFNFVLTDISVQDAIEYVIGEYSRYNFTVGNLNLGDKLNETINNYNCNQKTLFDVLEYFAQITESVWTTRYVSDTEIAIDFYLLRELPQGIDLVYDKTFCDEKSIVDISYSLDTDNYRNKQIMTADKIIANALNTEYFIITSDEYKTDENISQITSVKVNNVVKTFATTQDRENGETADLYYKVGSNVLELSDSELPGSILEIKYYPQIPGRQAVFNTEEIERINEQLNNSGVIARYENRQDADTSKELNSVGQYYIRFKGRPEITITLKTINNDIYNVGDLVYFNNNDTDDLEDLVDTYAVKKKTLQIIQNNADGTSYIFYTYELSNNYNFESQVNYFDNQRAKTIGNIKEGDYINRYEENIKSYYINFDVPIISGGV